MLLLQRYRQRDISIRGRFIETSPGLYNKRFRLWLASRSQSNLTRWAAIPLFSFVLDWHCIQWRFKSNEENAWNGTCTEAVMGSFRGAICISS